jgi:hypothetical protein
MSDERIHRHEWENGRCKVCGLSRKETEGEAPPAQMSRTELGERLDKIENRIREAANGIYALLFLIAALLLLLLLRGCS